MGFRPGGGLSAYFDTPSADFSFTALGPLADGDIVRRMSVTVMGTLAETFSISAALSRTSSATLENLEAGIPLITRSTRGANADGSVTPAIRRVMAAGATLRFELYPGLRVSGGSGWIIMETLAGSVQPMGLLIAFEITRGDRFGKKDVEEA